MRPGERSSGWHQSSSVWWCWSAGRGLCSQLLLSRRWRFFSGSHSVFGPSTSQIPRTRLASLRLQRHGRRVDHCDWAFQQQTLHSEGSQRTRLNQLWQETRFTQSVTQEPKVTSEICTLHQRCSPDSSDPGLAVCVQSEVELQPHSDKDLHPWVDFYKALTLFLMIFFSILVVELFLSPSAGLYWTVQV